MARFSSLCALRGPICPARIRAFSVFGANLAQIAFEELNNYSGRLTRQIGVISGGFIERRLGEFLWRARASGVTALDQCGAVATPISRDDAARLRQSPQRPAIKPETISVAPKPVGAPTSG